MSDLAPVVSLLSMSCPAAITWLVVTVVVDAVERQSLLRIPHIGKEVFKVLPSRADHDSAATIAVVSGVAGARASINHVLPRPVGSAVRHGVPMAEIPLFRDVSLEATA